MMFAGFQKHCLQKLVLLSVEVDEIKRMLIQQNEFHINVDNNLPKLELQSREKFAELETWMTLEDNRSKLVSEIPIWLITAWWIKSGAPGCK